MRIFSRSKEEKELVLIFDIKSSSIGATLFEVQKIGIPKILLSIREPIIIEENININRFLFLTIKSLGITASRICRMGIGKPSKIFCVLSSPWCASQTRIIKLEKNISFSFTSKLADDLIKKEINLFKEEHSVKFSHIDNKIRSIEFKNIKTKLNGYTTSSPLNKKIKKLEMIVFISIGGDKILKEIEETIFKHFHSKNIKFISFTMASFAVVRDMFINQDNFLLVDISGEVTDVSIIKRDVLNNSISYPLGYHFMIRRVAINLDCTLSEAKSIISLYRDGHVLESTEKKFKPIINQLKTEWLKEFQTSLVSLSNNISVPATIFMTVDQNLADFFSKIIKTEQFNQHILTQSKFKIIFLDTKILHNKIIFKNNVIRDPFLIIETIYINRFFC